MICPKCKFEQNQNRIECPRCGIIFEKYQNIHNHEIHQKIITTDEPNFLSGLFFYVKPDIGLGQWAGQCIVLAIILFLGIKYMILPIKSNEIANSFFHLVNLPFHEAGHIFFRPFGRLMTSLGGSLGQLLMPLICMVVFLIKTRDPFGASATLWWFGENFIDIAPYINDARSLSLPLIGGNFGYSSPYGFHDWEFILTELGWSHLDHMFAKISHFSGSALMIIAYIWGGTILYKQYKYL